MNMRITDENKAILDYSLTCGDVDGHSTTRLGAYENLVQEAAGLHATMRGIGIYDLQKENRTWVIARSRMEIFHYDMWPHDLTVTTWAQDSTGFNCPRHVDACNAQGEKLFECETKWAVIDFSTGRPLKATLISERLMTPPAELQGVSKLPPLGDEDAASQTILFRYAPQIRYLDTDLNRHVNNLTYFNWCLDALPDSFRDAYKPSLVDVRWIKQCYRHDNLTVIARAADAAELEKDEPGLWLDIIRTEESGATTKVFDAWMTWKRREVICAQA